MVKKVLMTNDLAMQPAISIQQPTSFFLHQAITSLLIDGINA